MQHSIENHRTLKASRRTHFEPSMPPFTTLETSTATFIDLHPFPAALVDSCFMVQHSNEPFRVQFSDVQRRGTTLAEALGATPSDTLRNAIFCAWETGQPQRCTVSVLNREANCLTADVHLMPVRLAFQEHGCICFVPLPTPPLYRQPPEEDHILSEFKSRLYAMIVHDFRTPLVTIRTAASTIKRYFDRLDTSRRETLLRTIEQSVDVLAEFLNDVEMINTARSTGLNLNYELIDAPELCAAIIKEMQAYCNDTHVFSLCAPDGLVRLQADKRLLSRMIRNLLTNAVKFSPQGSTVLLEVSQTEQEVLIRVHDQGIGIPEQERDRVFDTFYRAKNVSTISGTGLGLALVKYGVMQQGGSIEIDSTEGVGTAITLHFPNAVR
jgi:signal transduction histidine kinase